MNKTGRLQNAIGFEPDTPPGKALGALEGPFGAVLTQFQKRQVDRDLTLLADHVRDGHGKPCTILPIVSLFLSSTSGRWACGHRLDAYSLAETGTFVLPYRDAAQRRKVGEVRKMLKVSSMHSRQRGRFQRPTVDLSGSPGTANKSAKTLRRG